MISDKFGSKLDWKSKIWFFNFLNVYVSWIEQDKIVISQVSPAKFRYFADQNGPKGALHEDKFWHFSNTKMNITDSWSSKSKWKKWGHLSSLLFFFLSYSPNIAHFFANLCWPLKKFKSIKVICLYPSERPHNALLENSAFL